MLNDRKLIVLTPVKNEAWILPTFLSATSVWADYIIIADQSSTDGSIEIYKLFPKVVVINNDSDDLDEGYRDYLLVSKARELVGINSILFRIDADEVFTPYFKSKGFQDLISSSAGSIWHFNMVVVGPKFSSYGVIYDTYGAFVDDGREYERRGLIHKRSMFQIIGEKQPMILQDMVLLHLQFVDWKRMQSKHRWYQCFEKIHYPEKSVIDIYRMYHWMYDNQLFRQKFENKWIEDYKEYGVNLLDVCFESIYWWDNKVRDYITKYGASYFRRIETNSPHRIPEMGRKSLLVTYLHLTKYIFNRKRGILYKIVRNTDTFLKTRFDL